MKIGIVGHEAAKFTSVTEAAARGVIRELLGDAIQRDGEFDSPPVMVSGHCHLGGIDIWAEEEADDLGVKKLIFPPANRMWTTGYMPRNLLIAQNSDIVHCIVVRDYPPDYKGDMRFDFCYHCKTRDHVKSGGCWTALKCPRRLWHIILPDGTVSR